MVKGKNADSISLLSKDIAIEGDVEGNENLHVDGHIKGSIKLTGNLTVGNSGTVEANVEAVNVVVQGKITGDVLAHKQLEIQPSGKLIGDCTAGSIDIRECAVFEGRSNMIKSPGKSAKPAFSPVLDPKTPAVEEKK